jgi:hypothetical protein
MAMKMLLATGVGFLAGWLYGSERARSEAQRRWSTAPQSVQQARQSVASVATTGAERLSGLIDSAPLPPQVKDAAGRVTSRVRPGASSEPGGGQSPVDYIGTPGVESAAGRDRTQDGDLPPDLGRP